MTERSSRERCVWHVLDTSGNVYGQGMFFETDYEAAVNRAKAEAASYGAPGRELTLEVGALAILRYRF